MLTADTRQTAEQHSDALMAEIRHEIRTYGVRSLAAVIATLLETDDATGDQRVLAQQFRHLENGHMDYVGDL